MWDRSEVALLRLLERLPDEESYSSDAYGAYGCLPVNKHSVGKGGAVNRNAGLHSVLRGRLSGLVRRAKGYSKADGMLTMSLALAWLKLVGFNTPARVGNTGWEYCELGMAKRKVGQTAFNAQGRRHTLRIDAAQPQLYAAPKSKTASNAVAPSNSASGYSPLFSYD